jgi:predicted esterase
LAGPAPWYFVAVENAPKVGQRTGQLIQFMINNLQLSPEDVHIVGFSLGGQLVAFIGQETNGALARITGLDPAG